MKVPARPSVEIHNGVGMLLFYAFHSLKLWQEDIADNEGSSPSSSQD